MSSRNLFKARGLRFFSARKMAAHLFKLKPQNEFGSQCYSKILSDVYKKIYPTIGKGENAAYIPALANAHKGKVGCELKYFSG